MNVSHHPQGFFAKPAFHGSAHRDGLTLSARRALAAFKSVQPFSFSSENHREKNPGAPLNSDEIERLLERNLLPRFHDEAPPENRRSERGLEAIELIAIAVIIGAVLVKMWLS